MYAITKWKCHVTENAHLEKIYLIYDLSSLSKYGRAYWLKSIT